MKLQLCLTPVLTCIALLFSITVKAEQTSQPEQNWYEVSVAIFKHKNSPTGNEKWVRPDELKLSFPAGIVALDSTGKPEMEGSEVQTEKKSSEQVPPRLEDLVAFRNGTPSDKEYQRALASIELSPNYEVLVKNSWHQPAMNKAEAIPVLIQAGDEYDGYYELEGSITLVVSRYLHIKADLWLADYIQQVEMVTPWWQTDSLLDENDENNAATHYQQIDYGSYSGQETITRYESIRTVVLNESRRMRSGELHYLDHPLFGALVKVVPIEIMEEKESLPEIDQQP